MQKGGAFTALVLQIQDIVLLRVYQDDCEVNIPRWRQEDELPHVAWLIALSGMPRGSISLLLVLVAFCTGIVDASTG